MKKVFSIKGIDYEFENTDNRLKYVKSSSFRDLLEEFGKLKSKDKQNAIILSIMVKTIFSENYNKDHGNYGECNIVVEPWLKATIKPILKENSNELDYNFTIETNNIGEFLRHFEINENVYNTINTFSNRIVVDEYGYNNNDKTKDYGEYLKHIRDIINYCANKVVFNNSGAFKTIAIKNFTEKSNDLKAKYKVKTDRELLKVLSNKNNLSNDNLDFVNKFIDRVENGLLTRIEEEVNLHDKNTNEIKEFLKCRIFGYE